MLIYNNEKRFNYIFKNNIWGLMNNFGPGSEIKNTISIREEPKLITKFNIKTFLTLAEISITKEMNLNINYIGEILLKVLSKIIF